MKKKVQLIEGFPDAVLQEWSAETAGTFKFELDRETKEPRVIFMQHTMTLAKLQEEYREAEAKGEALFTQMRFLRLVEAQVQPCSWCKTTETAMQRKSQLPCYCSICSQCLKDLSKQITSRMSRVGEKQFRLTCESHNLPVPETLLEQLHSHALARFEAEKHGLRVLAKGRMDSLRTRTREGAHFAGSPPDL